MGGRDINGLLNEIERRFHLADDQEGAEMTYMLRTQIETLRWSNKTQAKKSNWLDTCLENEEKNPRR